MKLLVIGDFHIPYRAKDVPRVIKDKILQEKFDLTLCTGDLEDRSVLSFLSKLGELHVVQGNMDYLTLPESDTISAGKFKIGLIHGDGIYPRGDMSKLAKIAREMGVDIIVSGHTHKLSVKSAGDVLLLDPGSATGCWGGGPASGIPSFIILEIEGGKAEVHAFELVGDSLKEKFTEFNIEK